MGGSNVTKLLMVASVAFALCKVSAAAVYRFDDVSQGTATPFFVADQGVAATFSSPQGGVFFVTFTNVFQHLTGNILVDADTNSNELDIDFSEPLLSISLVFALNTLLASDTLELQTSLGGTTVGSTSVTGSVPPGLSFPEGVLSFSGTAFDRVRLTSSAQDFGIDDVSVRPAALGPIPEPSFGPLAGVALLSITLISTRRRNRTAKI
jgi:hypothetical protein